MPALRVRCRSERIAGSKEHCRERRQPRRAVSIADVTEYRDGEVHSDFGCGGDDVDLHLSVGEVDKEQGGPEGVDQDRAGKEAVEEGGDEGELFVP